MSIQYAGGTNVNTTLTQVAGTRAELAQWVRDQLVAAGWSSSGAATDYQVTSATTPQNLRCRVRCYDPGSGNCARFKMSNQPGTLTQTGDFFLLPAVGKVWYCVANRYQAFVYTGGIAQRGFMAFGVPYLAGNLPASVTEAIWGGCNSSSDTDTSTTRPTPRNCLGWRGFTSPGNQWYDYNGAAWELNAVGSGADNPGSLILGMQGPAAAITNTLRRMADLTDIVSEAVVGWSTVSNLGEAYIMGQLWDGAIVGDTFPAGTLLTIDAKQFVVITDNFAGGLLNGFQWQVGSLCLYAP